MHSRALLSAWTWWACLPTAVLQGRQTSHGDSDSTCLGASSCCVQPSQSTS